MRNCEVPTTDKIGLTIGDPGWLLSTIPAALITFDGFAVAVLRACRAKVGTQSAALRGANNDEGGQLTISVQLAQESARVPRLSQQRMNTRWHNTPRQHPLEHFVHIGLRSRLAQRVYVWFNDEDTLRKARSKTDVYETFRRMLARGEVPDSIEHLLRESFKLN